MAKKRSCRRTENENILHDRAVKLRKMTDEQLITFIDNQVESARNDKKNKTRFNINSVIEKIGKIKGIGATKLDHMERDTDNSILHILLNQHSQITKECCAMGQVLCLRRSIQIMNELNRTESLIRSGRT